MTFLSVIIPTYKRNDLLALCLACLTPGKQSLANEYYEVIVTDDDPAGGAQNFVANNYPWLTWVQGPQRGPASNRNNGAKHANGDWLVFIDDDCLPSLNLLKVFYDRIINDDCIEVIEGAIEANRAKKSFSEEAPINIQGGFLWSCNFAIKKPLFSSIGGFDEAFPYPAMEDVDLRIRLLDKEVKIYFARNAIVVHPWREKRNLISNKLNHFSSLKFFIRKHPNQLNKLNPNYYLVAATKRIFFDLFPNLVRYRFRGINIIVLEILFDIYFAIMISRISK